jgi:hypothetical protein
VTRVGSGRSVVFLVQEGRLKAASLAAAARGGAGRRARVRGAAPGWR